MWLTECTGLPNPRYRNCAKKSVTMKADTFPVAILRHAEEEGEKEEFPVGHRKQGTKESFPKSKIKAWSIKFPYNQGIQCSQYLPGLVRNCYVFPILPFSLIKMFISKEERKKQRKKRESIYLKCFEQQDCL